MPESAAVIPFQIVGERPLDARLTPDTRPGVGTVFLRTPGLVTRGALHAMQRLLWIDTLNEVRVSRGEGPLTEAETEDEWTQSVDLLFVERHVLVRPDPNAMDLAFQADELLQQQFQISKRFIRFLNVTDERVRAALRLRGEYWRMSPLPHSSEEIAQSIAGARVAIAGLPVYYYNRTIGTRLLTLQEFEGLAAQPDPVLRQMLLEIKTFAARRNRLGSPEVDFFLAHGAFGRADVERLDCVGLDGDGLRRGHAGLAARFRAAVPPDLRRDDPVGDMEWRNQMFAALVSRPHETAVEEIVHGLSPEFFMQIEWLPGARTEEGELLLDPVFAEAEAAPEDAELQALCDPRARAFIFNYVREFGDIEHVNVGRIGRSLSISRNNTSRNTVYIAEVKQSSAPAPVVRIIRLQKWGIAEHLDEGNDLLTAILRAEEYTDYILDRRLGCRQLGMHLPPHVSTHRISERYTGRNASLRDHTYWITYRERDYLNGCASDKLPAARCADPAFNLALARLLGEAAAANIIVGRMLPDRSRVLFDDGDEVIMFDRQGQPVELAVSDHTGTFTNYDGEIARHIEYYAEPVNRRAALMPNAAAFADRYLAAFVESFAHIQHTYRTRRRAFDSLFKHRPWDPNGSMAYRWFHVLKRLDAADPHALAAAIRACIKPLPPPPAAPAAPAAEKPAS